VGPVFRCAHLDVFETEPLPADSPLWEMPNLIVTPHNASASAGNERRSVDIFLENLERWARGGPLLNLAG
jgi:phosphoglycerate dehydrogenase-like enzyme